MAQVKSRKYPPIECDDIHFLYRPAVGVDEAHGFKDVRHLYILLKPLGPSNIPADHRGGKGGITPALGVIVNAIVDALGDLGVTHLENAGHARARVACHPPASLAHKQPRDAPIFLANIFASCYLVCVLKGVTHSVKTRQKLDLFSPGAFFILKIFPASRR